MALNTPESEAVVIARMISDVDLSMAPVGGRPAVAASFLNAIIVSLAERQFDTYQANELAAREALPDTAEEFAERWAAIYGVIRNPGSGASGFVVATGAAGKSVPINEVLATGDGKEYIATATVPLTTTAPAISSLTRVGTTATAIVVGHGLASNVPVTISGAVEAEYNITNAPITVVDEDTFTYTVSVAASSPATGAPIATHTKAIVPVVSSVFNDEQGQVLDAALQFQQPIPGVDDVANVDASGLTGATDLETVPAMKTRYLDVIQNPVAHFNVADIRKTALTVAGVTRVFVQEVTPSVGFVTVYFMRDLDATPIPNSPQVAEVRVVLDAIRPADMIEADLIVAAPVPRPTNFVFTELSPNTASMKSAIEDSLRQFFDERVSVGDNVDSDAYRSAIFNTIDITNGALVQSFTLSAPAGDITINSNEIGTLGSVTFSV